MQLKKATPAKKEREYFVNNIIPGNLVAFTVLQLDGYKQMLCGKVLEVYENKFVIQTANGSIFYPKRKEIVWVKQGSKWPIGIYNALHAHHTLSKS